MSQVEFCQKREKGDVDEREREKIEKNWHKQLCLYFQPLLEDDLKVA
jgi:hypothetical protein